MMISQLCESYHWSLRDAMSITMPQLIMLGHAAGANAKKSKEKSDYDSKQREKLREEEADLDAKDPVVWNGKRLSQLSAEENAAYMNDI